LEILSTIRTSPPNLAKVAVEKNVVGELDGSNDGCWERVGRIEGASVGRKLGNWDGKRDGELEGDSVGR
jgi:hypothetical protein